jgi:hypothetical protein
MVIVCASTCASAASSSIDNCWDSRTACNDVIDTPFPLLPPLLCRYELYTLGSAREPSTICWQRWAPYSEVFSANSRVTTTIGVAAC